MKLCKEIWREIMFKFLKIRLQIFICLFIVIFPLWGIVNTFVQLFS